MPNVIDYSKDDGGSGGSGSSTIDQVARDEAESAGQVAGIALSLAENALNDITATISYTLTGSRFVFVKTENNISGTQTLFTLDVKNLSFSGTGLSPTNPSGIILGDNLTGIPDSATGALRINATGGGGISSPLDRVIAPYETPTTNGTIAKDGKSYTAGIAGAEDAIRVDLAIETHDYRANYQPTGAIKEIQSSRIGGAGFVKFFTDKIYATLDARDGTSSFDVVSASTIFGTGFSIESATKWNGDGDILAVAINNTAIKFAVITFTGNPDIIAIVSSQSNMIFPNGEYVADITDISAVRYDNSTIRVNLIGTDSTIGNGYIVFEFDLAYDGTTLSSAPRSPAVKFTIPVAHGLPNGIYRANSGIIYYWAGNILRSWNNGTFALVGTLSVSKLIVDVVDSFDNAGNDSTFVITADANVYMVAINGNPIARPIDWGKPSTSFSQVVGYGIASIDGEKPNIVSAFSATAPAPADNYYRFQVHASKVSQKGIWGVRGIDEIDDPEHIRSVIKAQGLSKIARYLVSTAYSQQSTAGDTTIQFGSAVATYNAIPDGLSYNNRTWTATKNVIARVRMDIYISPSQNGGAFASNSPNVDVVPYIKKTFAGGGTERWGEQTYFSSDWLGRTQTPKLDVFVEIPLRIGDSITPILWISGIIGGGNATLWIIPTANGGDTTSFDISTTEWNPIDL